MTYSKNTLAVKDLPTDLQYVTVDQLPANYLERFPFAEYERKGNPHNKNKRLYYNIIAALDTETSRLTADVSPVFACPEKDPKTGVTVETHRNEQSIMYIWMIHILHDVSIVGRTWDEFRRLLADWNDTLSRNNAYIVLWVHNLSYDWQFLRAVWDFKQEDVFCVDSRKILKATMGRIELRCSYLHSNMSLKEYTHKMQVKHEKLSGDEYNYDLIRYPWTPLDAKEIAYCLHDVIGLCEALEKEMEVDGDNLYTIPLTSTGYIRREVKKAMKKERYRLQYVLPDIEVYEMLREAFRGGNNHANRYYAGRVLENVKSADRSSSYPDVQCNRLFPESSWKWFEPSDFAAVGELMNKYHKAFVARLRLDNVALKNPYDGCPYIPLDKCRHVKGEILDNGRILKAESLEITVTDIDLKIIMAHYTADYTPLRVAYATYGRLPDSVVALLCELYKSKTEKKDIIEQYIYYMKDKNKLNSVYGMTAQDPGKKNIIFDGEQFVEDETTLQDRLDESYRHAFITYAWGVWTTAWARYELQCGIDQAGAGFVYTDTDSVKYMGDVNWSKYNRERIRASKKSGAYATDKHGVTHYMGVFEEENGYKQFATLGAKKYAFVEEGKEHVGITIAGVTKSKGGAELEAGDKYGKGLERFCMADEHPFIFRKAGGTEIMYNDAPNIPPITIDGHRLEIGPNAVIRPSTYALGITAEYENLLKYLCLPLDKW